MVNDLLTQLGFSDKEIAIYLAVLQQGKATPTNIAKITKINRTTVYSVAKELIDKGVITEDIGGATTYLVARPPQDLMNLAATQERKVQEQKKVIEKAIWELQTLDGNAKYSIPKITFISEDKLEDYLYKEASKWNQSIIDTKTMWWGFQDATFVKSYEKWIDWYWEQGSPSGMQLQLLSNESAETVKKKKFTNRKIKYWKGSKDFTATTWVNGDFVIMIVTSQRPHYLVEIHDKVLAHNLRELFKGIWADVPESPMV